MGLAIAVFLFMAVASAYRLSRGGAVTPFEIGALIIIFFALLERSQGRYEYEADGRGLKIRKTSLLGKHEYEVSYRQVIGIYRYQAKLIGYIKFRRTFRLHSALDARDVWTIAYQSDYRGKVVNERIYFKPSSEMLRFLAEKIPGKVMVPETQVITDVLSKE